MPDPLNKIGVAIYGGLGNQMFQYASALGIASHHNATLYLDLSWFEVAKGLVNTTPRKFALNVFDINHDEDNSLFSTSSLSLIGRCKSRIAKILPAIFSARRIYSEGQFSFDPLVFNFSPPFLLNGYWQSGKYFSKVSDRVFEIFGTPKNLSEKSRLMMNKIENNEAICVHIRRGDYVTNSAASEFHGLCSLEYYHAGINQIAENLRQPHCFIFSDDIEWSKSNLITEIPTTFIDFNGPNEAHQDLWLMAACKHFVIANSSLSWWGAYLGRDPEKEVVAPKHWFRDMSINTDDLYMPNWIRL